MTTRTRTNWKPNSRGYYERQIGWKRTRNGNLQQHKFLLGTDLKEAKRRERKLREIWEEFAGSQEEAKPIWPPGLLEIAKRVAKGVAEIAIPRKPNEMQATYAGRIRRMQKRYPVICFVPSDTHAFEVGQEALRLYDAIDTPDSVNEVVPMRGVEEEVLEAWRVAHAVLEDAGLEVNRDDFRKMLLTTTAKGDGKKDKGSNKKAGGSSTSSEAAPSVPVLGSLHSAIRAYVKAIEEECHRPELGHISSWGRTQVRQLNTLMEHHKNQPLAELNCDGVEALIAYWRRRPIRKKSKTPITKKSASNYIAELRRFFRWLHRTSAFAWRKPEDYSDISVKVVDLPSDRARSLEQVDTFSLEELKLLMQYAQPMERLLLLLGLNCGFGAAEIASLQVDEVRLREAHKARFQEVLGFETTGDDSFVKRIRRKNGVYGEFLLFPLTVQGLEWSLKRRRQQDDFSGAARIIQNDNGEPLDKPTKSGNRNQQIPNYFDRLIKRITDDDNEMRKLSFGKLRKTGGDLIRKYSDGEVSGVFLCHGSAVKSDDLADVYTNRPFGKVFKAIREVQEYLTPVFEAAGSRPFDPQPQAYTGRKTISLILSLHEQGQSPTKIAKAACVSPDTVRRHVQREFGAHD